MLLLGTVTLGSLEKGRMGASGNGHPLYSTLIRASRERLSSLGESESFQVTSLSCGVNICSDDSPPIIDTRVISLTKSIMLS